MSGLSAIPERDEDLAKEALRCRARALRRSLDPAWRRATSREIQRRVRALPEYQAARTVAVYLPLPGEVDTGDLLEDCRQRGIPVCVPAFRKEQGHYDFAWVHAETRWTMGPHRACEPRDPVWIRDVVPSLVVVPGLAFDRRGTRLGRGGGHYDRLLAGPARGAFRVGVTWNALLLDQVPSGPDDVPMDVVVTEERVLRIAESGGTDERRKNDDSDPGRIAGGSPWPRAWGTPASSVGPAESGFGRTGSRGDPPSGPSGS